MLRTTPNTKPKPATKRVAAKKVQTKKPSAEAALASVGTTAPGATCGAHLAQGAFLLPPLFFKVLPTPLDLDAIVTRTIENNLSDLEYLRNSLARKNWKSIDDVRDFGDTAGGNLLSGIEETLDYDDLVSLIEHMKDGLAERRVAAKLAKVPTAEGAEHA